MASVEILEQNGYDFLWIDEGNGKTLWMWNVEEEIEDQRDIAQEAYGRVLVAGYGLGMVQKFLLERKSMVDSVLTVERLPEVLDVCKNRYGKLYGDLVVCDYYNFQVLEGFDTIVGDIWANIAERHLEEFEQFEEKAQELLARDGKVLGWGVDYYKYLQKRGRYYD